MISDRTRRWAHLLAWLLEHGAPPAVMRWVVRRFNASAERDAEALR